MTSNPDPTWAPPLTEAQFNDQYEEDSTLLFQRLSHLVANQRGQRDQARPQVANQTAERDAAVAARQAAENQATTIPELEQQVADLERQLTETRQLNALLPARPAPPVAPPAAPPRQVHFEIPPPPIVPPPVPPVALPVAPAIAPTPRSENPYCRVAPEFVGKFPPIPVAQGCGYLFFRPTVPSRLQYRTTRQNMPRPGSR